MNEKVAIVIPWFGKDLKGGAEQQAWHLATRLAQKGMNIVVLTTCSREFLSDWSVNYYKSGSSMEGPLEITRFPVKKRDRSLFDRINAKLLSLKKNELVPGISPLNQAEELVYVNESINSPELMMHLENSYAEFDAFIFLPYLFPSTLKGITLVKGKSILMPCLHDECYAYLNTVADAFCYADKIFLNSEGERDLVEALFGAKLLLKSSVMGGGVEIDARALQDYSKRRIVEGEYILYLGRRDTAKNTHLIVRAFDKFIAMNGSKMKLVLAGPGSLPVNPVSKQIIDMGLVSDEIKINLLKYCRVLVNPSENESFSRVIYEAWFTQKPVIIHRRCRSTYRALEASDFAGWSADSEESFSNIIREVETASAATLGDMGRKGHNYAMRVAQWDSIMDAYCEEITKLASKNEVGEHPVYEKEMTLKAAASVLIMYAQVSEGDAVGNDVLQQYAALKDNDIPVYLYAESYDYRINAKVLKKSELLHFIVDSNNIILYHHANYWQQGEKVIMQAKSDVLMRYNSVTPPEFYRQYSAILADTCAKGREQTQRLVASGIFSGFVVSSGYTADELKELGAPHDKITVLGPFHDIDQFKAVSINSSLLRTLIGDKVNVLFVGRVAPNKGIEHLIDTVRTYVDYYGRSINLNIIGGVDQHLVNYYRGLKDLVRQYRLSDVIHFAQRVSLENLHTYYSASDVLLLMSEHEGFCVPILEAQFHGLPVITLDRSAVKGTLGPNQLLFAEADYALFACAIHTVWKNRDIRMYLAKEGLRNYRKYDKKALSTQLIDIISLAMQRRAHIVEA
jgi:glycosyltransferase involved in cell wall biosynthesis